MILYGASGHGRIVAEILRRQGEKQIIFFDDSDFIEIVGEKVIKPSKDLTNDNVIITIGLNNIRKRLAERFPNFQYSSVFHEKSIISESASIQSGTVVMAGAIISSNCEIGKHVIINTGSTIDHDCKISDFAHISPNSTLCGGVIVGEGVWIGAGATIKNGITIGSWAVVGAGSVVLNDVPADSVYVGNPARFLKLNEKFK